MSKEGYKGHRPGTRKGTVHKLFDEHGEDRAMKKGLALELAKGTIYSWFSEWRNPVKKTAKKAAKKSAKKVAKPTKRAKVTKTAKRAESAKNADTAKARAKVKKSAAPPRATIDAPSEAA